MNYVILTEALITLLVMINPLSVIPPYLSLTKGLDHSNQRQILKQAMIFAFFILSGCVLVGKAILHVVGISTFALQIAGGILFFKFGYDVMTDELKTETNEAPGLVPLGFPIIAGPGSITAIILLSSSHTQTITAIFIAIILVLGLSFIILYYAHSIVDLLGSDATTAIVKLMGLLVLTIGIQLILGGLQSWLLAVSSIT